MSGPVNLTRAAFAAAQEALGSITELAILAGDAPANVREARAVADGLRLVLGVSVAIETVGYTDRFVRVRDAAYQIAMLAWKADYDDPLSFLAEHVSDGAAGNQSKWSNAPYNAMIARIRATVDPEERYRLLVEAERSLMEELPVIPLLFRGRYVAVREELRGLVHLPVGPSPEVRFAAFVTG